MIGLHRLRYLKPAGSSSDEENDQAPDSDENFDDAVIKTTKSLVNYKISGEVD